MCLFFIKGVRTSKNFKLKLIIQGLLRLYNENVFFLCNKNQGFAYGINR